jgi:hypothetical protein
MKLILINNNHILYQTKKYKKKHEKNLHAPNRVAKLRFKMKLNLVKSKY